MTKIRALGLLASVLLAGTVAAHAAPVAGSWKVAIGTSDAPCTVTLAAAESDKSGTATADAACPVAAQKIARWSALPGRLTLKSANGETIATLKADGATYTGSQFADNRKVTLTPVNSSVAQSQ